MEKVYYKIGDTAFTMPQVRPDSTELLAQFVEWGRPGFNN